MNVDTEFHKVCHCALRKDGSSCECGAMQTQKPPNLQVCSLHGSLTHYTWHMISELRAGKYNFGKYTRHASLREHKCAT